MFITEGATVVEVDVIFCSSSVTLTGLNVDNLSYSGLTDGGNKIVVNVTDGCVVAIAGLVLGRSAMNRSSFSYFKHVFRKNGVFVYPTSFDTYQYAQLKMMMMRICYFQWMTLQQVD